MFYIVGRVEGLEGVKIVYRKYLYFSKYKIDIPIFQEFQK
jgi:hypothetical protein